MSNQVSDHKFVSFDGGVHCSGKLVKPESVTDLVATKTGLKGRPLIPRGAGMSFAAASFGDDVISVDSTQLNRIETLNETECTVTVQAGTSVGGLLNWLVLHGYYIPIVPGYPTITIGGCIASAVHGKNQLKDGTFDGQVLKLRLFHEDHGILEVSPEREAELFELTLGGFGLTGTILEATIKVIRLPSAYMDVVTEPLTDIMELPALLEDRAARSEFIISWHDFMQTGGKFGTGFVQWGNFASEGSSLSGSGTTDQKSDIASGLSYALSAVIANSLGFEGMESDTASGEEEGTTSGESDGTASGEVGSTAFCEGTGTKSSRRMGTALDDRRRNRSIYPIRTEPARFTSPLTLTSESRGNICQPFYGFMSTGLMNALYNYSQMLTTGPPRRLPIGLCFFPSKILRDLYYHFFGKSGFFEHQVIIPAQNFELYIEKVHWWLIRNNLAITIASSKMFDGSRRRLLRFSDKGVCFAINFPRCAQAIRFMRYLDELTVEAEGLPNIAKDSRLPLLIVQATYPEYELFKTMLKSFDPKRRYQSELSRRLKL